MSKTPTKIKYNNLVTEYIIIHDQIAEAVIREKCQHESEIRNKTILRQADRLAARIKKLELYRDVSAKTIEAGRKRMADAARVRFEQSS